MWVLSQHLFWNNKVRNSVKSVIFFHLWSSLENMRRKIQIRTTVFKPGSPKPKFLNVVLDLNFRHLSLKMLALFNIPIEGWLMYSQDVFPYSQSINVTFLKFSLYLLGLSLNNLSFFPTLFKYFRLFQFVKLLWNCCETDDLVLKLLPGMRGSWSRGQPLFKQKRMKF